MGQSGEDADEKTLTRLRTALALNYLVNVVSIRSLPPETVHERAMQGLLIWVGRLAGIVGVLVVVAAVVERLLGVYRLGGLGVGTILEAGMASILIGCLGYLAALAERKQT